MKPSKKSNTSLIIQLLILVFIAIIGIMYIVDETPVSSLEHYDKQPMVTPFGSSDKDSFFFPKGNDNSDGDDISLSGKKGRYEEALIGK